MMKAKRFAVLAGLVLSFVACTKQPAKVAAITPLEAMGELKNDFAVLVDVREASELKDGMAAPAHWMAMSKITANDPEWQDFVRKLPKDKKIIFYCASGRRSGKVSQDLADQGFKTANMGGFKDWVAAGLPIKKN